MKTYEKAYNEFTEEMNELGLTHHPELYRQIMTHLGPSVHDRDAALVACSDESEIKTIKNNFLKKKLGIEDEELMDKVIHQVCHALGESNRQKHRPTFYYLLTAILNKEDVFINTEK